MKEVSVPFADLREFIAELDDLNEIRMVQGADWDLELGTICELNYERQGKALLFDDIPGYPSGYRVLTNGTETYRRALASIEFPLEMEMDDALEEFERRIRTYRPVPPKEVTTGPILENVFHGDDIDLLKFPSPRWHEGDGGRYIGTGNIVIMRDPDNGEINLGTYRVSVHDRNTAGIFIAMAHTGNIIARKYWAKGEACPVAVACGQDPILLLGGSGRLTIGRRNEYELAGHFRGAPIEVIREEFTGLPIPATAEIVLAGYIPPRSEETRMEGPFGEFTGYYASGARPEPVIHVQALYHRNNPIILGVPPEKYRGSTWHFGLPSSSSRQKEMLKRAGIEDVLDIWQAAWPGVTVVQVRQRYAGHAIKAAMQLVGDYTTRFIILVDEDINPRDPHEVFWALGTRCDPATAIQTITGLRSTPLDPIMPQEKKDRGDLTSSCAIINACKPYEWKDNFPITNIASPEQRQAVLTKWKELF